jgi:hypothetical protein
MSDAEAVEFVQTLYTPSTTMCAGRLLDEFVRRLGEMREGMINPNQFRACGERAILHDRYNACCNAEPVCRPAVLFVQREAAPPPKTMNVACLDCDQIVRAVPDGDFTLGKEVLRAHKIICPKRDPPKVTPENCPCRTRSLPCCNYEAQASGHCACHDNGDAACLKCGRQPAPKPLSAEERIAEAAALLERVKPVLCSSSLRALAVLRGERT